MKMYSIYDITAHSYSIPFGAVNNSVAKRNFRYTVKALDRSIIQDLELRLIADFDSEIGELRSERIGVDGFSYPVVDTGLQFLADIDSSELEVAHEKSSV